MGLGHSSARPSVTYVDACSGSNAADVNCAKGMIKCHSGTGVDYIAPSPAPVPAPGGESGLAAEPTEDDPWHHGCQMNSNYSVVGSYHNPLTKDQCSDLNKSNLWLQLKAGPMPDHPGTAGLCLVPYTTDKLK